jgi:hypothetical protein
MSRLSSVSGALVLTVLWGSAALASIGSPRREAFQRSCPLDPKGKVVVDNPYGDVRITAWDRDEVRVEAIKTGPQGSRLDDAQILVEACLQAVTIRTLYSGVSDSPASVEYRISVPRGATLESVKLTNGGLSLSGLEGPVRASAVNGDITAERLGGHAELSTVNGRLVVDFRRISGDKPISLKSVNGPIRLSLPAGAQASVEAHNIAGGITANLGRIRRTEDGHRLRTVVNRGGTRIQLKNVNGGISVLRADT